MATWAEQLDKEVSDAIDWYLDNAGKDQKTNIKIFQSQIDHYRGILVYIGLAQICSRLENLAMSTMTPQFLSGPMAKIGDQMITNSGLHWLAVYSDVISELARIDVVEVAGKEINKCHGELLECLHHYGEGIGALAAIMLTLPPFISPLTKDHLEIGFQHAQGTGLKIAITYALVAHGDAEPFEKFSIRYLAQLGMIQNVLAEYRKKYPNKDLSEAKLGLYKTIANPRLVELICFDIATNGIGPTHMYPDWVGLQPIK